jgi:aminopeptidase-like protein
MTAAPTAVATADAEGAALHAFAAQLYPICRSITGDGVRRTLDLIGRRITLKRHEVPSGSQVFDWEVPLEWNIEAASVIDCDGHRVVDFAAHNLHILNYSEPVRCRLKLEELRPRLHYLPAHPDWIPYRTSYYRRDWGFCLKQSQLASLLPGSYDVRVDSTLERGSLSYGECLVRGRTQREVLFFTHVCHPSLANDNTSGMAIATALAEWIGGTDRRYSYRFVFAPGTIGSLCWLKANETRLHRVEHGLVLGLLGDSAPLTYKHSRRGDCAIDRIVPFALRNTTPAGSSIAFEPYGYDERQLCSPGFNLPVGRLTRSVNGGYPQYHSSADDLGLISPEQLKSSLEALRHIVEILEGDRRYINLCPKGEPRLGKRGLYGAIGGRSPADRERAMLWVLNQSDGTASVLDIAQRSQLCFADVRDAAEELTGAGLLKDAPPASAPATALRAARKHASSRKNTMKRKKGARK